MRTSQVALFLLLITTSHVFLCTAADIESARHRRLKLALRPSAVADRAAEEEDANRSLVETQAKLEPTSIAAIVLICTVVLIESYHVVLKFKLKKSTSPFFFLLSLLSQPRPRFRAKSRELFALLFYCVTLTALT